MPRLFKGHAKDKWNRRNGSFEKNVHLSYIFIYEREKEGQEHEAERGLD